MKLSEAIRLGAMAIPPTVPGKCDVFIYDEKGQPCGACALGTIGYAVNVMDPRDVISTLFNEGPLVKRWPLLITKPLRAPRVILGRTVASAINWLFEGSYGWSREQIADWVETIEQQHEAKTDTPEPVAVPA